MAARKTLSSAETELRVAEANLNAAEKKLHVLGFTEEQIEVLKGTHQVNPNITLFSPIAGKVVTNTAVLGAMVDETTEILTIMDPSILWVEAAIYERDIARIRTGQGGGGDGSSLPHRRLPMGQISYISDVLHPETRTITVRTEVANTDLKLKPGMFADLTIELNQNGHAIAIPTEAVLDDHGLHFCLRRPRWPTTSGPAWWLWGLQVADTSRSSVDWRWVKRWSPRGISSSSPSSTKPCWRQGTSTDRRRRPKQ